MASAAFLISKPYVLAMTCGLIEYVIEGFLFPELKSKDWVSNIGLLLVVLGEVIRKTAIITAEKNFTHDIKMDYHESHKLVIHGIYGY
jgi:protein-S-isoprenylcysteine O-methyltransferase